MGKSEFKDAIGVKARHDSGYYEDFSTPYAVVRDIEIDKDGQVVIETYVGGHEKGNVVAITISHPTLSRLKRESDRRLQACFSRVIKAAVLSLDKEGLKTWEIESRLGVPSHVVHDVIKNARNS